MHTDLLSFVCSQTLARQLCEYVLYFFVAGGPASKSGGLSGGTLETSSGVGWASVVTCHLYFLTGSASRIFAAIAKNVAQGNPNFSIRRHGRPGPIPLLHKSTHTGNMEDKTPARQP